MNNLNYLLKITESVITNFERVNLCKYISEEDIRKRTLNEIKNSKELQYFNYILDYNQCLYEIKKNRKEFLIKLNNLMGMKSTFSASHFFTRYYILFNDLTNEFISNYQINDKQLWIKRRFCIKQIINYFSKNPMPHPSSFA